MDIQKEASSVMSVIQTGFSTIGSLVVPSSSGPEGGIHPAIDEYEAKQRRRILSTILNWGNTSGAGMNDQGSLTTWNFTSKIS